MDTPFQTDCSRESSEDEVFAPRVTVERDLQRWEEGSGQPERAKVRLGGQRPWDGGRQQRFWDIKTLTTGSANNIGGCGTDRGPSGSLPSVSSGLKGRRLGVRVQRAEVPACTIFDLGFPSCTEANTSRTN